MTGVGLTTFFDDLGRYLKSSLSSVVICTVLTRLIMVGLQPNCEGRLVLLRLNSAGERGRSSN